jgi:hypothetical protein
LHFFAFNFRLAESNRSNTDLTFFQVLANV